MTIEQLTAWATFGTAVGTILLAFATFVLARRTKSEVEAANRQAKASAEQSVASLQQARASHRQAELAEQALSAQSSPLLTDVPFGIPAVSGYSAINRGEKSRIMQEVFGPKQPHYSDASVVNVFVDETGGSGARLYVPFRNVGNGAALIGTVEFLLSGNSGFTGSASTPVVPVGEVAEAVLKVPFDHHSYAEPLAIVNENRPFSVVVTYSDVDKQDFRTVRLDISPSDSDWFVRQVHWADSREEVIRNPTMSSHPTRDPS